MPSDELMRLDAVIRDRIRSRLPDLIVEVRDHDSPDKAPAGYTTRVVECGKFVTCISFVPGKETVTDELVCLRVDGALVDLALTVFRVFGPMANLGIADFARDPVFISDINTLIKAGLPIAYNPETKTYHQLDPEEV